MKNYIHLFLLLAVSLPVYAQNDSIQLLIKVREIKTTAYPTDNALLGVSFSPDEYTYKIWARETPDRDTLGWIGGSCLTSDFNPDTSGVNSDDFNDTIYNATFSSTSSPDFFDLKLEAWQDDLPSDSALGICTSGRNRCDYDCCNICCGTNIFGVCTGISEEDDNYCNASPFKTDIEYQISPPCQWYNHGFIDMIPGACSNDFYKPRIESFWRYKGGTGCNDPIPLGSIGNFIGSDTITHYNSNECYTNNWPLSPGNDVFYSFHLNYLSSVLISLCDSVAFDSHIYLLDDTCTVTAENGDSCGTASALFKNLSPGNYTIVVDGENPTELGTFILSIITTGLPCSYSNFGYTKVCEGSPTQFTDLSMAYPGTSIVSWNWDFGDSNTSPQQNPTHTYANAGSYNVTLSVTDDSGCSDTKTITAIIFSPPTLHALFTQLSCPGASDGIIYAISLGGQPPYQYAIDTINYQDSVVFDNLSPGGYTVYVKDSNGCQASSTDTIYPIPPINPSITSITHTSCTGLSDGSITLNATGGRPPYEYSLDSISYRQIGYFQGLSAGNYTYFVKDFNGCLASGTFTIFDGGPSSLELGPDTFICTGMSASLTLDAGPAFNSYQWSNGATTQSINVSQSGVYSVTANSSSGCSGADTISVTFYQSQLILTPSSDTILRGDSVAVTASGSGIIPFSFSWQPTPFITYPLGSYSNVGQFAFDSSTTVYVSLMDGNSCAVSDSITIYVDQYPAANAGTDRTLCLGDSLTLGTAQSAKGGHPPFSYSWSPQSGLSCDDCPNPVSNPTFSTTYQLRVTDSLGNVGTDHIKIQTVDCSVTCLPDPNIPINRLDLNSDSLDCIVRGEFYHDELFIGEPVAIQQAFIGTSLGIQSLRIDSITNLPCGISWAMSESDFTVNLGETACLAFSGITNDSAGQYTATVHFKVSISGGVTFPIDNINYTFRVVDNIAQCAPIDTAATALNGCVNNPVIPDEPNLTGTIYQSNQNPLGFSLVYLINFNHTDSTVSTGGITSTDQSGHYAFTTTDTSVYVKAIPDLGLYPGEMPTYHTSSLVFQTADPVVINPTGTTQADITTIAGTNPGGLGFIGGFISQGAGKRGTGDPVEYLPLFLMNSNNSPVAYTKTDAHGYFSFSSLDFNTYSVWVDKPFVENALAPKIGITASKFTWDSLQFKLHPTILELISDTTADTTGTGLASVHSLEYVKVFPNPNEGSFTLQIVSAGSIGTVSIELLNITGQQLYVESVESHERYLIKQFDNQLSSGLYFIKIQSWRGTEFKKIIVE